MLGYEGLISFDVRTFTRIWCRPEANVSFQVANKSQRFFAGDGRLPGSFIRTCFCLISNSHHDLMPDGGFVVSLYQAALAGVPKPVS